MSLEAILATWELTAQQVTSTEKLLLLSLARRAGEEGECWPSVARMVADTCLNRKTVVGVRQQLIDKNMIIYTGEYRGRSLQIPVMRLTYLAPCKYSTSTDIGMGTSTDIGMGTSTDIGTLNKKEEYNKENNTSSSSGDDGVIEEGFNEFWETYPKKQGRKEALKAWKKGKCEQKKAQIITDVQKRSATDQQWLKAKQFIPNASTYLNQERWEDEILPVEQLSNFTLGVGTEIQKSFNHAKGWTPRSNYLPSSRVQDWGPGHPGYEEQRKKVAARELASQHVSEIVAKLGKKRN